MTKKMKKLLAAMIVILIILIIVIIVLAVTDTPVVTEPEMGETILAEKATQEAVPEEPTTPAQPAEPVSVDLPNEKEVRLYVGGSGEMDLVSEYNSTWSPDYDIAIFEAINSDEDVIYYDNYYMLHEDYWNAVATDVDYKIGYELSFDVNGENRVITILEPQDITSNADLFMGDAEADEVTGYMGVWVYNDIGHDSVYVHLTQADMTDGVLMTSIKLRPTPQSDAVSNFRLKVFSYSSEEEFNSSGRYIGTHGYEIPVNNR